ncbi:MAG: nuclear transport factor 2 family protein [Rhodospirillaceae bacterium]|nr:nuclear transport factor 2 family protein [Rhodospirillaceae bacterium]
MTDMTGVVEQILTDYVDRWNDYNSDGMISFWDAEDEGIIYVAEEIDTLHGWNALEGYIRGINPEFAEHLITVRDVTARTVAPGVIQAFWSMSWSIYFVTENLYPKPIGGDVRVTALLREKDDGWKFFHWIEGPIAALFQLQRALEKKVDPRLLEKLKAKGITF